MSVPHEPSYYEIALTNRQVLTVFVVLLVCVVGAFFSGVWIGRRGMVETAELEVARIEEPEAEPEQAPLPELHFFSEAPQSPAMSPPEEARTSVRQPPPAQVPVEEESLAGASRNLAPAALESEPATVDRTQTGSPAPAVDTQEASAPSADAQAAGSAEDSSGGQLARSTPGTESTGELLIQVFFSADEERARSLVERLVGSGYPAFLSPVEVEGQVMFRVRVGPYGERSLAEEVADKVQRAFKLDTWITH